MRPDRTLVVAIGLTLCSTVPAVGQDLPSMPSFEEVLSLERMDGVSIAPDGTGRVAYTVRTTDWDGNRYDTEIWISPTEGAPYQLTRTGAGSSNGPAWSPDGRWLAFTADRGDGTQVFLIDPRGGEARAVTGLEDGVSGFAWAPAADGDGWRMSLRVREGLSEADRARRERYGDFAVEDAESRSTHLWAIDIEPSGEAGEPWRLTEGAFHVAGSAWSPDGRRIAYERRPDPSIISFTESDLYLFDVESGASEPLVVGPGPDGGPVWSPDGEWILFSEYDRDPESLFYLNGELALVPSSGGDPRVLTAGFDEQPGGYWWTAAGIRFTASDRTRRQLFALDARGGGARELTLPWPIIGSVDYTPDGEALAVTAESGEALPEVFRVWGGLAREGLSRAGDGAARPEFVQLTSANAAVEEWALGTREVISWKSEDGAEIEGVLFKPADYDDARRYTLLVQIHGGPTGTSRPTLVPGYVYPIVHWLARGAVVLQPNYRGSAGYGEAFRGLNVRNLGVGDMWDVMSGVEALIEQGVADPDRLGAMGWSQGGYISAFLTTNTDAFRAISVGAGISNWMTYYVNTDIHPFTRQYLKGTPWNDPDIYARTSPMTRIENASTPTLIQHGEFDRRVPTPNAYELYQGLQDQGVETRLVIYKGFGHGIDKPKELLAGVWHNWQWFGRHIWNEEIELPLDVREEAPVETAASR